MSEAARCDEHVTPRLAVGLAAVLLLVAGCESKAAAPAPTRPLVLIGIDGADWTAIERLWSEGKLPHLKALADRGTRLPLGSDYMSRSPVVWTTIATGVAPEVHGIRDFVVTTDQGDVPLSSTLRRVPALWNILTDADRKVAVLGWWASWPVEDIAGVMVSDRCFFEDEDVISPEFRERFEREAAQALATKDPNQTEEDILQKRDWMVAHLAPQLAAEGFDLMMVYFKMVDRSSHMYWKYFEPGSFPPIPAAEMQANQHVVAAYEEVDAAVGRIVAAASPETNFLVVSDHGMKAQLPEKLRVAVDINKVLEKVGLLARDGTRVDFARSLVYPFSASDHEMTKTMRYSLAGREEGGRVEAQGIPQALAEVEAALARVTYESGTPTFVVRAPTDRETRQAADFAIDVLVDRPSSKLIVDGEPFEGAVQRLSSISGSHTAEDDGILIAAGPDFAAGADLEVSIHGVCPTILYALGLPVAKDGLRDPYRELFTREFRRDRPVRKIKTFGTRDASGVRTSEGDGALVDELRQVGYLR